MRNNRPGFGPGRLRLLVSMSALLASPVFAQSSVTLYGGIDLGIDYVNNSGGKSLVRMRDGMWDGMIGSRFGLKGTEDLGGGLKAIFKLESGFDATNGKSGQGGRMFGRNAYVGLADDSLGTVTLGRQYDLVADYLQPLTTPGQLSGPFNHGGDIDNTATSFRVNNAVKYASPSLAGLTFGGMYAFSAAPNGSGTTGLWAAGAAYGFAGLKLGAVYEHINQPAEQFSEGDYIGNTTGSEIGASGPFSYIGNPANQKILGAGISYDFGRESIGFSYTNVSFDQANGTTSSVRFDNYDVWGKYNFTPFWSAGASFIYTSGTINYNGARPKYYLTGLSTNYALSKSTSLYAMVAVGQAGGSAKYADIFDYVVGSASTTNRQVLTHIGIYHMF
jgi:predicted porin